MQILRVCDTETKKAFAHFPVKLYKNNPYWGDISHQDLNLLFDPEKNPFFQHGEAERWIITNFRGNMIGRIAAFIDNTDPENPLGSIDFFECIDHPKAAFSLFDQCKDWFVRKKVQEVVGPHNLLHPLRQGGLLTNGFQQEAVYGAPYHHDYYQGLFEEYGFRLQHRQHHFLADLSSTKLLERCQEKAGNMLNNQEFTIKRIAQKDFKIFAEAMFVICQDIWKHQSGNAMIYHSAEDLLHAVLPVLEEHTAWCAYYQQEPVGFFICLPEGVHKYTKGKKAMADRIKNLFQAHELKITASMMGVKKQYQDQGIGAALMLQLIKESQSGKKHKWLEITGIDEHHTRLIELMQRLEMKMIKTYHAYRYVIKEETIVVPMPKEQRPSLSPYGK